MMEFFRSLNYENGLETVTAILRRFPMQYGTTLGRDGDPQIRPLEFKFEENGALYFDCVDSYESFREMTAHPYLQLCIGDQETMSYLRVGGRVNFTRDPEVIRKCFENSPVLTSQYGDRRDRVVGYYLTEAWAEFASFSPELPNKRYRLMNPYDREESCERDTDGEREEGRERDEGGRH